MLQRYIILFNSGRNEGRVVYVYIGYNSLSFIFIFVGQTGADCEFTRSAPVDLFTEGTTL
jgi:hypothetical protein